MTGRNRIVTDVGLFLRDRTRFIRFYFDSAEPAFRAIQANIEGALPPFDSPPYSEDGEPPFLAEWLDAEIAVQVLGLSCVSLLSDSLKLYLNALQNRVIGFTFGTSEAKAFKRGFLAACLAALGEILETDWKDCPAKLEVIEQIVLARNRAAHGEELTDLSVSHDRHTLDKHPKPFFADPDEWAWAGAEPGSLASLMTPTLKVSRDTLFQALSEVETLVGWIDDRIGLAHNWRMRQRARRAAETQAQNGDDAIPAS